MRILWLNIMRIAERIIPIKLHGRSWKAIFVKRQMLYVRSLTFTDKEILRQTRIFAFGYGLNLGTEMKAIANIVNNGAALQLYKSFINPSSNGRYPFIFYGSVSFLSFFGSPLFLDVCTDLMKFKWHRLADIANDSLSKKCRR